MAHQKSTQVALKTYTIPGLSSPPSALRDTRNKKPAEGRGDLGRARRSFSSGHSSARRDGSTCHAEFQILIEIKLTSGHPMTICDAIGIVHHPTSKTAGAEGQCLVAAPYQACSCSWPLLRHRSRQPTGPAPQSPASDCHPQRLLAFTPNPGPQSTWEQYSGCTVGTIWTALPFLRHAGVAFCAASPALCDKPLRRWD